MFKVYNFSWSFKSSFVCTDRWDCTVDWIYFVLKSFCHFHYEGLSSWREDELREDLYEMHWISWSLWLAVPGLYGDAASGPALVLYRVVFWEKEVISCIYAGKLENNIHSLLPSELPFHSGIDLIGCQKHSVAILNYSL